MRIKTLWKSALVVLTGLSIVLPNPVMAGPAPAGRESRDSAVRVRDVSLAAGGTLSGYVVDAQGRPAASEPVAIHQGRRQVALTKTNVKGHFEVKGLKGGVYQVSSRKGSALFRVWKNGTAPKRASKLALVVNSSTVARAQLEGLGLSGLGGGMSFTTLAIGAGIVAGATVAIVEASDNDSKVASP